MRFRPGWRHRTARDSRSGRRTTRPTAPRPASSCCSARAPAARRSAARSPRSPPTSARSTTTPPARPCWSGPGLMVGTYDYVASTRYSWGGVAFPLSGGARTIGFQLGTFGFKDQPVYTEEQPDGTGRHLLGQRDVRRRHLRPELLRPVLGGPHRQVRQRPARHGERQRVRGGLRHQLPRVAQQPSGQVLVRAGQPGLEPELQRHRPPGRRAADSDPGRGPGPDAAAAGQPADEGLPAPHDVPGRAGLRCHDRRQQPAHRARRLQPAEQQQARLRGGQRVELQQARRLQLRLRPARQLQLHRRQQHRSADLAPRRSTTRRSCRASPSAAACMYGGSNGFALGLDYAYKYLGILGPTNFFSFTLGW